MSSQHTIVNISTRWLNHRFLCSEEYIKTVCRGKCCQGSGKKIMVSLRPGEVEMHERLGLPVDGNKLRPSQETGLCPHKKTDGLCCVHGTGLKPLGCIVSPLTINKNNTLIIRHRYVVMGCHHPTGRPAYEVFFASLVALFGPTRALVIKKQMETGCQKISAPIPTALLAELLALDVGKRRDR